MKFTGKDSHVRRLTKAESIERGIPPSQERYVVTKDYTDPFEGKRYHEGQTLPNRQGRNVQAQERGNYKSYSQYSNIWSPKASPTKAEVRERNSFIRTSAKKSGRAPDAIRTDPDVRAAYTDWAMISNRDRKDKSPSGPLAQWLVALDLRDEDADYDVGQTPQGTGD